MRSDRKPRPIGILIVLTIITGCRWETTPTVLIYPDETETLFGDVILGKALESIRFVDLELHITGKNRTITHTLPEDAFFPAFLYDLDRDGKLDIFIGTVNSPNPSVYMMSGTGNISRIYTSRKADDDAGIFYPSSLFAGRLYIAATDGWPDNPRGIHTFDLETTKECWFISTPSIPVGVAHQVDEKGNVFTIISQDTRVNGDYTAFGKENQMETKIAVNIFFYRVDNEGNTINAALLLSAATNDPLSGIGLFYTNAPDPDSPLSLIQIQDRKWFLHKVDPKQARIISSSSSRPLPQALSGSLGHSELLRIHHRIPDLLNVNNEKLP